MNAKAQQVASDWRFGGGLFWVKDDSGEWRWWCRSDLKQRLRVEANVASREAKAILDEVAAQGTRGDTALAEAIAWHKWAGRYTRVRSGRRVIFLNSETGVERKRLSLQQYNAYLAEHFPTRKPASEGGTATMVD